MNLFNRAIVSLVIIPFLIVGLAVTGGAQTVQQHGQVNQMGGGVLGGIAGGILGAQIGGGSGRIAAIIGGTLAGAALGSYVGGYMDRMDQERMSQTLETQPTGEPVSWQNPDTGHEYHVTPIRTYKTVEGQYCREFTTKVNIGGSLEDAYGTACRMPDGSWKIQGRDSEMIITQPHYEDHFPLSYEMPIGQLPSQKMSIGRVPKGKIPKGHWPPPGLCRIWFPGHPPGLQPPPGNCAELSRNLPPGAWLISR